MASGNTTTGSLGDSQQLIIDSARIVREYEGRWNTCTDVQRLSEDAIYDTVTYGLAVEGKDVMPPFKGELSAGERRSLATYVKSLSQP